MQSRIILSQKRPLETIFTHCVLKYLDQILKHLLDEIIPSQQNIWRKGNTTNWSISTVNE
jgi:hypothetical protein